MTDYITIKFAGGKTTFEIGKYEFELRHEGDSLEIYFEGGFIGRSEECDLAPLIEEAEMYAEYLDYIDRESETYWKRVPENPYAGRGYSSLGEAEDLRTKRKTHI